MLCKYEDLSFEFQHSHKKKTKKTVLWHATVIHQCCGRQIQMGPGALLVNQLARILNSTPREKTLFQKIRWRTMEENIWCWALSFVPACILPHTSAPYMHNTIAHKHSYNPGCVPVFIQETLAELSLYFRYNFRSWK